MSSGATWTVEYAASAARAIKRLDPQVRRRVKAAIEALVVDPMRGKPLQLGLAGLRSLRTGDYRIIYKAEAGKLLILIVAVGHQREVYARLRDRLR